MSLTREDLVADRVFEARRSGIPIPPVRGELAAGGIAAAYRVQKMNVDRLVANGARKVGRKIGLTSQAIQRQLGVDTPDVGVLLDTMGWRGDDVRVPLSGLIAPRIEAEIAFVLGDDIPLGASREKIVSTIAYVAAAAEIVDSAIADWAITILDTVADNASSGRFALGTALPYNPRMDLASCKMQMRRDDELVSSGSGAASLGDPLNALAWLAGMAIDLEDPLRKGDIILAGALGPMTAFAAATYEIKIDGFARLIVTGSR